MTVILSMISSALCIDFVELTKALKEKGVELGASPALRGLYQKSRDFVRRLRSFRLKRFEFYANFAKLKRRLRSFRLTRFEVHANFAMLSTLTLMSVKFVVAKHSS